MSNCQVTKLKQKGTSNNTWVCAYKDFHLSTFIVLFLILHYVPTDDTPTPHPIRPGGWINIEMPSYQYRKSHCGDKTILRPSNLHNGISYTGKMTSLYWIRALLMFWWWRQNWLLSALWHGHMYVKGDRYLTHWISIFLPKASFDLQVLSFHVSVCPSMFMCINNSLVRAITHHPFKQGSQNLDQRCKAYWLRSRLF